jgi:outer membrane lipoprotein-sorting protein
MNNNNNNNNNNSDRVEHALESLRDRPVPEGPSEELLSMTADRLRSLGIPETVPQRSMVSQRPVTTQSLRRNTMKQGYAGILAASALFVIAGAWIGLFPHSSGIAFADVKQQLEKLRTVRYVNTRLVQEAADDMEELKEMERKGVKIPPGKVFRTAGNGYQPRIIRVAGRHLQRTETLNAFGVVETIEISDLKNGTHVTQYPKEKKSVKIDRAVKIDSVTGKKTEEPVKPALNADLFASISTIPAEATTELPARMLEGKKVIGFFLQQSTPTKEGTVTWERTYWVDATTKLPVRVEISHYSTDKRIGRSDWVQSGFTYDEEFSADLFNTEPPEGYSSETQKVIGIDVK